MAQAENKVKKTVQDEKKTAPAPAKGGKAQPAKKK